MLLAPARTCFSWFLVADRVNQGKKFNLGMHPLLFLSPKLSPGAKPRRTETCTSILSFSVLKFICCCFPCQSPAAPDIGTTKKRPSMDNHVFSILGLVSFPPYIASMCLCLVTTTFERQIRKSMMFFTLKAYTRGDAPTTDLLLLAKPVFSYVSCWMIHVTVLFPPSSMTMSANLNIRF